jgi:hypothetical protein
MKRTELMVSLVSLSPFIYPHSGIPDAEDEPIEVGSVADLSICLFVYLSIYFYLSTYLHIYIS